MGQKIKGIKQSTLEEYNSFGSDERKGYLWLVRDINDETGDINSASIYFGNRLYASTNEIIKNILKIEGDDVD